MSEKELHVISDGKLSWSALATIALQIYPYVTAIHIREKMKSLDEVFIGVQYLLEQGIPAKRVYVNGFPSIALALQTGGVQLPGTTPSLVIQDELCRGIQRIGVSVHHADEAKWREKEGADYVMFGHIFATNSKQGVPPRGLEQLRQLVNEINIPVIAIGGMTPARVQSVLDAGASGIAVMSGIWDAADPLGAVLAYQDELRQIEVS
ncbi:thiamine phosphate synthase [Paenibacillus qinlingensis]|uniref:Thiazole tautomerase (Transcriptional regulator TenI) n=1 Tax=Paenibacillus qinlingensis TaxID=1837343 RepID=A0ABU1NX41_9BACL|nr:thiamine phosphate synthase [Paenibacillus qinlingensis]MDR6552058.1 thiazole tautomerase (transcriptional regulator TenI) [Paenibacillus qinlingensis]